MIPSTSNLRSLIEELQNHDERVGSPISLKAINFLVAQNTEIERLTKENTNLKDNLEKAEARIRSIHPYISMYEELEEKLSTLEKAIT